MAPVAPRPHSPRPKLHRGRLLPSDEEIVERIRAAGRKPLRQIAAEVGVSHETVRQLGIRYGLTETAAPRRDEVLALRAGGLSWAAIAARVGLSPRRVRDLCGARKGDAALVRPGIV